MAALAESARESGAKLAPTTSKKGGQSGQLLQELLASVSKSGLDKKPEKIGQKVVHLVGNLPPLSARLVEMIQEGSFVDFAWFPVMEDGPSEGLRQVRSDSGEETSVGADSRKRVWKEVPDILTWSTCFSLFQTAWGRAEPKMFETLMAYRDIVRLA